VRTIDGEEWNRGESTCRVQLLPPTTSTAANRFDAEVMKRPPDVARILTDACQREYT
jgi:hypothetical protein